MLATAVALTLTFVVPIQEPEILHPGTGPHKRPVVIADGKARDFFNQGLNFMFAFNHGEAKRSFRTAAKYDPKSAMAWWGLAMANGPHINNMAVEPSEEQEAVESLAKAMRNIQSARPVDQALIRATLVRFKHPQPKDRNPLDRAYADAMREVWRKFPNDADVAALFAESVMNLSPWNQWTPAGKANPGTNEVMATLESAMKLNRNHPLALHLYIHAVEASPWPQKALPAADRLRNLQPGLGHNVHMPSHIDVRLGLWEKAILANEKAIVADREYRAKRPDQFIYRIYMAHNSHMLALAAMMTGQSKKTIEALDDMVAVIPEDFQKEAALFIDGFFAMPIEARKRFGKWDEVLAAPMLPERFPLARTFQREARAVSYAAKGMVKEARAEQWHFAQQAKKVPAESVFGNNQGRDLVRIARHLMNGEILVAEGRIDDAVRELKTAIKLEDALRYDEPPSWIQPVRHTLGALLTKVGRHKEAADVYRADLKKFPHNGWATYGLANSLRALGQSAEAEKLSAKFDRIWAKADEEITSSCLCIPGKG